MNDIVFITGNQHKADYLAKWLGMPINHQKVDLTEIQSLDAHEVVEHKVREAYKITGSPVLVEDISLTFHALGRLPGTLIKWFLEELGNEGLCKLLNSYDNRSATASITYGLFDGETVRMFEAEILGNIPLKPRGNLGFGWNAVFVPDGTDKTYAEMTDEELEPFSHRAKAVAKLKEFLQTQ
jgi:non-canonical purine NTP pyrophosphatase (RdgB/HAM1 family)